ncbi:MAG: phosphotransferase [Actinomycetota bacterium]
MVQSFRELSEEGQIKELTALAHVILAKYDLTPATVEMINHGYNSTLGVVTEEGEKFALRINVNSPRSNANLRAEIAWILALNAEGSTPLPRPIPTSTDELIAYEWSDALDRSTPAILFSWLDGEEVNELQDFEEPLLAAGRLMANLHMLGRDFQMPNDAGLKTFDDVLWGFDDHLRTSEGPLNQADRDLFTHALLNISATVDRLYQSTQSQIIHADLHGGNLMWDGKTLSVFDFDDCGIGLPIQDLGVSLYYFREPENRANLLKGYTQISELPPHEDGDLRTLFLQRRLQLLNYLLESETASHRELIESFLEISRTEATAFLEG